MRWPFRALTSILLGVWLMAPPARAPLPVSAASDPVSGWLQGWPMVGHDPQRTNRSPNGGPIHLHALFQRSHMYSQPLIGPDNAIYGWSRAGLVSLGAGGRRRWVYPAGEGDAGGPAALRPDGALVAVGYPAHIPGPSPSYARVFAITRSGHLSWKIRAHYFSKGVAPFVTDHNQFYAPFVGPLSGKLDVLSASGRLIRRLTDGSFYAVASAPDGTIYAFLKDQGLVALDGHDGIRWQHDLGISDAPNLPLLVGQRGTVYAASSQGVTAFNPVGAVLWQDNAAAPMLALAESPDGSILAADTHSLTKFEPSGHPMWKVGIGTSTSLIPPALAVDAQGTSYVATSDGDLRVISSAGTHIAQIVMGKPQPGSRPAIALGAASRLVVLGADGIVHVYGG